MNNIKIGLP